MTDTSTTTELETTIDTYVSSWNETDPTGRAALVAAVWSAEGRHLDPLGDVTGHDGIDAHLAGVQEHYPDHRVERTSAVDTHHDRFRFTWRFVAPDGSVVVTATDVGELDPAGRIHRVDCFFGDPAPLPE